MAITVETFPVMWWLVEEDPISQRHQAPQSPHPSPLLGESIYVLLLDLD